MSGKLYICPTPIGNLEDITYRTLRVLNEVDLIAAEDTRHSMKLLNHFEISKPLSSNLVNIFGIISLFDFFDGVIPKSINLSTILIFLILTLEFKYIFPFNSVEPGIIGTFD